MKQRLLGMQPIFGLFEDPALRAVYYPGGYLLAPVHRVAVQEDGVRGGVTH